MKNSDILFIYDAKMCNPNGDPDDENRPRMDVETSRNIVTDVRLKRYLRDYWYEKGEGVFVSTVEGKTVDATKRLAYWISEYVLQRPEMTAQRANAEKIMNQLKNNETIKASDIVNLISSEEDILRSFLDVRLFGATMLIKDEKKGQSYTFTGPVQFNWGYSLNKVEMIYSNTITSTFAGRTRGGEEEEYGTMGNDYRLYYSLLAFHGIISAERAKHTKMTESDVFKLEEALIKAIPLQATRSKIGQYPRLLVRVQYVDGETFIGDLRRYLKLNKDEGLRDITEFVLDISELNRKLSENNDRIELIRVWQDDDLTLSCDGATGKIEDILTPSLRSKVQTI